MHMKKLIAGYMLIYFFACNSNQQVLETKTTTYHESNGVLMIEAEQPNHFSTATDWKISEDDTIKYLQATQAGDGFTAYHLSLQNRGKYRMWVNTNAVNATLNFMINQENIKMEIAGDSLERFIWSNNNISYNFKKGEHIIKYTAPSSRMQLDKIMLIRDERKVPPGHVYQSAVIKNADKLVNNFLEARQQMVQLQPLNTIYGDYPMNDAYAIQKKLSEKLSDELGEIVGYKMAFATESALEKYNLNEPVYGPIFSSQQIENGAELPIIDFMQFHIENEIAFVLAKDIRQPLNSIEEIKPFIRSIHLSFDMADGRFDRSNGREGINDFVASGGGAHRFMLSPAAEGIDFDLKDLILSIELSAETIYQGNSNEAFGNPWQALLWIVNDLLENGEQVKAGMIFLTGKVDAPYMPEVNEAIGTYVGKCKDFPDITCTVVNTKT